jgi:hypothetical protein
MQTIIQELFGPVCIYVRQEGAEWVAWADPFSEFGTGPTEAAAIEAAKKSVEDYLGLVAVELQTNPDLRFLAPLSDEEKEGAKMVHFHLFTAHMVEASERVSQLDFGAKPRPIDDLRVPLRNYYPISSTPLEPCLAYA